METLGGIKLTIDNLISTEENRLKVLRQIKLLLDSEELNTQSEFSLAESVSKLSEGNEIIDPSYPKHEKIQRKVIYLLTNAGRALKSSQLIDLISQRERPSMAKKVKKTFSSTLNALIKNGSVISFKYNNDNKLAFYVKPEWVERSGSQIILKPEHCPATEILAGIPEDKLKPELIVWNELDNQI